MKNHIVLIVVALVFLGGYSISGFIHAQNNTTTYAPVVDASSALVTSVTSIIIAIAGLIGVFVKAGILKKEVGTVAVMASDAAVAIRDNRQTIKDLAQNTYETVKITSPEAAAKADEKLAPIANQASKRIDEYIEKVDKFTKIGSILSKDGEKTTSEIKDDSRLKDNIPDEIVST